MKKVAHARRNNPNYQKSQEFVFDAGENFSTKIANCRAERVMLLHYDVQ